MPEMLRTSGRGRRYGMWGVCCQMLLLTPLASFSVQAEEAMFSARFQSTFNGQRHPGFHSAYAERNSLTSEPENMYTFSATAHLGMRPWEGGEVFFNGEVVQGTPFTGNLVGMGSFSNGEITRAAGENLKYYTQRLFLRQTWNQGGGDEQLSAGLNQFARVVDRDRMVLTLGNFSTLDVFDDNAYAKDPRNQFMNWGNWTYAAYDYAADARGFGWGLALAVHRQDWAYRLGRMTGPLRPNEQETDFQIGAHYGDQVEVEHAHTLLKRPGKLRVLWWRNRGNLARFDDAMAYRLTNPGADAQSILQTRYGEQFKYGLGFNLEQELADNLGGFLRVMKADGQTETHAFTEVDESLSTGILLSGKGWGREDDTLGLAVLVNGLSRERRDYLSAGGISYFIGDGALDYRPERILEGFYRWQLSRLLSVTLDYQRVHNPAYNAERGPVDIFAFRLHSEF